MRLLRALRREQLDRPPVWFMRQAGRYLPEYRRLRERHGFEEAMTTPHLAAEITLQPLRRFPLDAAIVFSDIMTPLLGMGVSLEFAPGPRLAPLSIEEVIRLPALDPGRVHFTAEAIARVRAELDPEVAMIGFAGGPITVLAYLLEGGGSQQFPAFRGQLRHRDAAEAVAAVAHATRVYLDSQVRAGADVVQVFDTWAGLLSADDYTRIALPALQGLLAGIEVPTIYFAPGAGHLLDGIDRVGATGYGVDWRLGLDDAWRRVGLEHPIQGNLDPSVLLADEEVVRRETRLVLDRAAGRPGHVFNLGHGILPQTPLASVEAMVGEVLEPTAGREPVAGARAAR